MPSPAPKRQQEIQEIPLKMVGGNHFGRYDKISVEQTWNMIISDEGLVPYAGYKNVKDQSPTLEGRGIYSSSNGQLMLAIWGAQAYLIKQSSFGLFTITPITGGLLATSTGDVFISENNNAEIAFTDGVHIYVYNWMTVTFKTSTIGTPGANEFAVPVALTAPGYISFQNGRLIVANTDSSNWYLSDENQATVWPNTANRVGALQTKPDKVQAAVPSPGGGNNLYLFGHNVIEQWQDVGTALFPYQRSSTFNVDYGTVNASSIAAMDDYVVWISSNENSGATLMVIEGNRATSISTDGIDFKLANLQHPDNCTGFLFRQDGHVIYQFTFPQDNLSYAYDFTTKEFFTVTDQNLDFHIARNVVFFNNDYYFVSLKGGNLYRFGTQYTDFDYGSDVIHEMPRLRVTPPIRLPSQRMFIIKSIGFTVENGQPNVFTTTTSTTTIGDTLATEGLLNIATENGTLIADEGGITVTNATYVTASEVIDLAVSRDGGESFGNSWRQNMNHTGKRRSRFIYQRGGQANDLTCQLRFSGYGRFVAFDGIVEAYQ